MEGFLSAKDAVEQYIADWQAKIKLSAECSFGKAILATVVVFPVGLLMEMWAEVVTGRLLTFLFTIMFFNGMRVWGDGIKKTKICSIDLLDFLLI